MAFRLLDAVLSTGAGNSVGVRSIPSEFTVTVAITGAPTSVIVSLEGRLKEDGSVGTLASHTMTAGELTAEFAMFHVSGKPVRFINANLTTLSGGTTPTVTVLCDPNEHD